MTYDPNTPYANISPKDQVTPLQTNFSQFETIWAENHTALNDPHEGDHEKVILTRRTTNPQVSLDLDLLFCKDAVTAAGTQPQLFVRIPKFLPTKLDSTTPTNNGNPVMQLTYDQVNIAGPVYQTFLPGGYLFYFGVVTEAGPQVSPTSNLVTLVPTPTKIVMAIAYANQTSSGIAFRVSTKILTANTFNINVPAFTSLTRNFTWMAIALQ